MSCKKSSIKYMKIEWISKSYDFFRADQIKAYEGTLRVNWALELSNGRLKVMG